MLIEAGCLYIWYNYLLWKKEKIDPNATFKVENASVEAVIDAVDKKVEEKRIIKEMVEASIDEFAVETNVEVNVDRVDDIKTMLKGDSKLDVNDQADSAASFQSTRNEIIGYLSGQVVDPPDDSETLQTKA